MTEKDGYKNNSLVANYSQNLSNELKFTSNFRFSDTYKQYDKEVNTSTATHSEAEDSIQSSVNLAFQYKYDEKFINEVFYLRHILSEFIMLHPVVEIL